MSGPIKGEREAFMVFGDPIKRAKAELRECLNDLQRAYGDEIAAKALADAIKDILEFDHVLDLEEPLAKFLKKGKYNPTGRDMP